MKNTLCVILKFLLKVLLYPVILALSLFLAIAKFIIFPIIGIANFLALIFGIFGVYCLFDEVYRWSATPALIATFLLSPIGIPLITVFALAFIELARDYLKSI